MKIIEKDEDIIICIKPAGVLSTDEPGGMPELIRNALKRPEMDVRSVHRLDRVASGLMVYAGNKEAASEIGKQIMSGAFRKEYLAVIHGMPKEKTGRYEDFLERNAEERKTYTAKTEKKTTRKAILEYAVIQEKGDLSLVKIRLITGRTHQIRAQFSSRGMPLVGDRKYGAGDEECPVALWSCSLEFLHPATGKKVSFAAQPPNSYPWTEFDMERSPAENARAPYAREDRKEIAGKQAALKSEGRKAEIRQCPQMKKCGGCQLMYMPYENQLKFKQKKEQELLGRFGKIEPIIGMKDPYHYRNKVHAAFGTDSKGKIISGIYQTSSHRIVSVTECLLEDETADRIINSIRNMMPEFKMTAYDEFRETGFLRHVLVRRSESTKQIMVVLVVTSPIFKLQKPFLKKLLEKYPEITTVVLNFNDRNTPIVLGEKEKVIYGPGYIEDLLCGCRFRISPKSFYQVNSGQTPELYMKAVELAGLTGKETVLDAYCGTGTIGIVASKNAKQVAGVEVNREAVRDAIINAKLNNASNCWFTCGDAGEFMNRSANEKQSCDVVFMDPPRAGSTEKFLTSLVRMHPEKIVYISCNPETLARDLNILVKNRYSVKKIQPVDMFPHTEHVETVCLLVQTF